METSTAGPPVTAEIERKFVLTQLPAQARDVPWAALEQGYLAVAAVGVEVRLRREDERCTLTTKTGSGEIRGEDEVDISRVTFEAMWSLTEGRRVQKRRRRVEVDGSIAEIDEYFGQLTGLLVAEVEFSSAEASASFQPPDLLGHEVTGDARYANHNLAIVKAPPLQHSRRYRLRPDEDVGEELRRVALGRIESALEHLRSPSTDPAKAIHNTRTDLKMLRSLMRLVRGEISDSQYQHGQARCRDAGRLLSDRRDADVALRTLDGLIGVDGDQQLSAGPLRTALRARKRDMETERPGDTYDARRAAIELIEQGRADVGRWAPASGGFQALAPGLLRSYSGGRKLFHALGDDPSDEQVHEWRKRVKDLWYQLRLVRDAWPTAIGPLADEAQELSKLLGDHHDLSMLLALAQVLAPEDPGIGLLSARARRRQGELLEASKPLAERLYAEKPGRFVSRIEAYWHTSPAPPPADPSRDGA